MRQTSCDELLPCASCGKADIQIEHTDSGLLFAICKNCGTTGAAYPTETQAVRSWNKKNRQKGGSANV